MPPNAPSPAIQLSADGVSWQAPGTKLQVAASGTVYARLDSTAGVNQVSWTVVATDGSALPGSIGITTSGAIAGGERAQLTALGIGTAGRLQVTVNAGVGVYGNVDLSTTQSIVKWWVPSANGLEVGTVGEGFESDAVNGTAPLINAAIRGAGGGSADIVGSSLTLGNYSAKSQPAVSTTDNSTVSLLGAAVPIAAGKGVRIRATLSGDIALPALFYRTALTIVADYVRPSSGSASIAYSNPIDVNQPTYPWCGRGAGPITITGAGSDGGTQVKLTVANSNDLAAGNTVTVAGATTTGGLILNRQWIVDSVPDSTHIVLRGSVWTGAWTSGGTVSPNGAIGLSLVSNAVQVVATGITAAPWMASEDVHGSEFRSNVNGVYVYTDPGTTSGSGPGPSGASGTDGTAPYVRVGSGPGVSITWQAFLETWT